MADRTLEYVPVRDLRGHVDNPKSHDQALLSESMGRFGFTEPGLMDERTGLLVAGHGRLERLVEDEAAGREPPDGVRVDGDGRWWAPVVRGWASADDGEARAYLVTSNRLVETGGWLDAALAPLLDDLRLNAERGLEGVGFSNADVDAMLQPSDDDPTPADDVVQEGEAPARVKVGDLWQIGRHRLLCGDAADGAGWERLLGGLRPDAVYADPPYGINLQTDYTSIGHGGGKRYDAVIGDDSPFDPEPVMALTEDVAEQWWWGADYYRARVGGSWIVWDKRGNDADMDLDPLFGSVFELCWMRQPHRREVARILWAMTHGQQRPEEDARRGLHPTQKPVALALWVFTRWVMPGALVVDPYAGSGTTLMACEHSGRTAALIELSPGYCDVILDRWERHSGVKPKREQRRR